jgi:hypothetical protein
MAFYKFVAKLSQSSFIFIENVYYFFHSFLTGFWLGVMSEKSLDFSDELFYNNVKHYTDDKYNLMGLYQ